ncbi:uncharacterized protein LOC134818603 isoform X2 [Bolinopsis microptera]|uniref:uncharacterized protein LOC134818603 isoform X2 n=1 Tax=Bolinopsis microptera TaxID=2820187 RepID=UPI00307AA83A
MGQCIGMCCPPPDDDSGIASESSPLLGRADDRSRILPVDVDLNYPRDDSEQSKLDKIVRSTATAFVDINSDRDVSIGTTRDKESIYQSTLASLPKQETNAILPDCGTEDASEVFSKTSVTQTDINQIEKQAEQADTSMGGFRITSEESLVEDFNNTPKY